MSAAATGYVLEPGEARAQFGAGGVKVELLARSAETGGALTLMRYEAPGGFPGPPLHRHEDLDEAIAVLEGTALVRLGDQQQHVGAGGFVWMPRNLAHAFANATEHPLRFLGLITPPGRMEEFFAAATEALAGSDGPPDPAVLTELNERHGMEVLGPPLLAPQG